MPHTSLNSVGIEHFYVVLNVIGNNPKLKSLGLIKPTRLALALAALLAANCQTKGECSKHHKPPPLMRNVPGASHSPEMQSVTQKSSQ